jgi:hypothetical protein
MNRNPNLQVSPGLFGGINLRIERNRQRQTGSISQRQFIFRRVSDQASCDLRLVRTSLL